MLAVSSETVIHTAGGPIRTLTVSLIGAAALVAGLVVFRQQKQSEASQVKKVPPGESVPAEISLERLRELGY